MPQGERGRTAIVATIAAAVGIRPDQVEAVLCWLDEEAAAERAHIDAEEIDELARLRRHAAADGPAVDPGADGRW